ncbi:MAG: type II toxin-antitoxin system Phd/YefM family antitoxin [Boseongicola sp. SB0675_bin_26]|nr:type II toxin-antitoxin system Phd/YefM family antitoxin [Boseongicola sp. SB0675_bin_26]
MREIGAFEAKTHLSGLLKSVQSGEHITITKRGKPVAQLVPVNQVSVSDRADLALRIKKLRGRIANECGLFTRSDILSARNEGRRPATAPIGEGTFRGE